MASPLQYSVLENSMDRSLSGYCPWGYKEWDMAQSDFDFTSGVYGQREVPSVWKICLYF